MKNSHRVYKLTPHIFLLITLFLVTILCQPKTIWAESISDQNGAIINFSKPFSRIISLYPAHTENLFSLGLDQEIIGVSKNDTFPEIATRKPKFHYREDPEKFMAANPDLVLVRPMIYRAYPDLIKKLKLANITVISLQPTSIENAYTYWRILGKLTGRAPQAEEMISQFTKGLSIIASQVSTIAPEKRKKVYFEAIHKKMKTFAPGSISIFALESAGGINIAADAESVRKSNIAYYGKEQILSKADDIDIFLAQNGKMNRITAEIVRGEPGFSAIKAIQQDRIFIVDEAIVSRPTLRLLTGIKTIGKFLYPEVFK